MNIGNIIEQSINAWHNGSQLAAEELEDLVANNEQNPPTVPGYDDWQSSEQSIMYMYSPTLKAEHLKYCRDHAMQAFPKMLMSPLVTVVFQFPPTVGVESQDILSVLDVIRSVTSHEYVVGTNLRLIMVGQNKAASWVFRMAARALLGIPTSHVASPSQLKEILHLES